MIPRKAVRIEIEIDPTLEAERDALADICARLSEIRNVNLSIEEVHDAK